MNAKCNHFVFKIIEVIELKLFKMADNKKNRFIQPDYRTMYHKMFNAMNDATNLMVKAMRDCEEMYITGVENPKQTTKKD